VGKIVGISYKKSAAFTIVELLIVIVVIAILATIGVVGYGAIVRNANDTSLKDDLAKLGDAIKLVALDNQVVPDGGATSSNTGDSSLLPGVSFKPNISMYDLTVSNLYYCSGSIGGTKEFTVVAKGKSGKAFSYSSNDGLKEFTGYTWTASNSGTTVCGLAGYSAPYTWSYGYNPTNQWYIWAFSGEILTNLASNPSMETDITGWANYTGFNAPTRVTTTPWTGAARLSAVGANSSLSPRVYTDFLTDTGDVISVSFRVRSDGQAVTGGFIAPKLMNGSSEVTTIAGVTTSWTPDSNGWVPVSYTFTVPAGGTKIRLSIGLASATNYSGTMGIDGLIVVKGSTVPIYADGNTPRWTWSGTANNSTSSGPAL